MSAGGLFVVSAPSGAGKTSLVAALLAADSQLGVCVSHTTRTIRPGETDGVNYHFVTRERFEQMIDAGAFVEHADVFGNFYGTARESLASLRAGGTDVVLEIDWQGAAQVRRAFADAVSIFVLPPSRRTLAQRLNARGQDSADVIARRTLLAREEMSHYGEFDYLVVNDDFNVATGDLQAIVRAERLRQQRAAERQAELLKDLLAGDA